MREIELIKKENCITYCTRILTFSSKLLSRLKVKLQQYTAELKASKVACNQVQLEKESLLNSKISLEIANDSYVLEVKALKSDLKMYQEANGNVNEM